MGPFVAEAKRRGNMDFSWTQGTHKAVPPRGFEDYFGAGAQWRFFDHDGMSSFDVLERIREFPEGTNAEDTMRVLVADQPAYALSSVEEAVQWLLDMIDADPEIEVAHSVLPCNLTEVSHLLTKIHRASWDIPRARR